MVPLLSGVLITLFGGLTLYFDNKIFFYMKPTIINLLFAGILYFGKFFTEKPLLRKEIITLNHEALDRALYSEGAFTAAKWLMNKKPGLYSMRDVLNFK